MNKIMPFNFIHTENGYLVSNITRDFLFLNKNEFQQLQNFEIIDDNLSDKLVKNRFLCVNETQFSDIVELYRNIRSNLFKGTFLHIFVLTLECNLNCLYCQAESDQSSCFMSQEIAEKAIDIALESIENNLTFEFQGGEPLLNFDVLKHIVEYTNRRKNKKNVSFSLVTNTHAMTDEILEFLVDNSVNICISLDGPKYIHDKNRPSKNGQSNYDSVIKWFHKARDKYKSINKVAKVTALPTITRHTLQYPRELVDLYVELDILQISIRDLSPFGRASENWDEISFEPEEFIDFHSKVMDYIVVLNKENNIDINETFTEMYMQMIVGKYALNYTDLRSPCGATIAQIAYNWNGDIYTCDEGRMMSNLGIEDFKIGNVFQSTYKDCLDSNATKQVCNASCTESNPDCLYCVYSSICGVCPIYTYFTQGDLIGKPYKQNRCKILRGIYFKTLENLLIDKKGNSELYRNWGK